MDGILSQEPVVARHALALLVGLARHNATQLLEQHKELASLVNGAAVSYESSGMVHRPVWNLHNLSTFFLTLAVGL